MKQKKNILTTGGAGYIGSHTVLSLFEAGYNVIIADNLSNSEKSVIDNLEKLTPSKPIFELVDIADAKATEVMFARHHIDAVIHFAAYKSVKESVLEPLKYYQNNLNSLMNILSCMEQYKVNHLVFSSSCTVYGQPESLPVTELTPRKDAASPYGNTKKNAEDIIEDVVNVSSLNAVSLRYFNPIGAHPSGEIGELPIGIPDNLVPYIAQTASGAREVLSVFGGDYNTPDGSAIRDYIDVIDLAEAHVIALERLINNKQKSPHELFNIGTGKGLSVLELINTFEEANNLKVNYKIVDRRAGDIEQIYADTTLANNELGWKAKTPLSETLRNVWKWEQNVATLRK